MPYAAPRTLDEAVTLLAKNHGARVLAGGHTLLVEPGRSKIAGALLVDLRHVPNLGGISRPEDGLRIGAMTTLAEIAADPAVGSSYGVLAEAAQNTGDPQLRNRATLGGSLADTSPENDVPALAVLYAATIEIAGRKGTRSVSADDFLAGKGAPSGAEIITALLLPARQPRTGIAYHAQRNATTLAPICSVGVGVALADDGTVSSTRVVLVGGADRPVRLRAVEKKLTGKRRADALRGAASAGDEVTMRTDLFASADYRKHLTRVLTERALTQALERAGG